MVKYIFMDGITLKKFGKTMVYLILLFQTGDDYSSTISGNN